MDIRILLRMSRLARRPPSLKKVLLVFGIIAACLILFAIEKYIGWPDWLTTSGNVRGRAPKF